MLTLLSTVKSRLAIPDTDTQYDDILTNAIKAISARFDKETNRTLARTCDFQKEFDADDTELSLACYPLESLNTFELKASEADGWQEVPDVDFLVRHNHILSLLSPLDPRPSPSPRHLHRRLHPPRHRTKRRPNPAPRRFGASRSRASGLLVPAA
jgi:hypothetical protein